MARGRKTLFKDYMLKEGVRLAFHGFTIEQMADFWGVGYSTLRRWIDSHPDFRAVLKTAKQEADQKVEKGLYKRAIGFKYTEKTYERILIKIKGNGNGQPDREQHQMTLVKSIRKHIIPDPAAAFIWLKNRDPVNWRDLQERKVLGLFGIVTAEEIFALKKKALEELAEQAGSKEKKIDAS